MNPARLHRHSDPTRLAAFDLYHADLVRGGQAVRERQGRPDLGQVLQTYGVEVELDLLEFVSQADMEYLLQAGLLVLVH